MARRKPQPEESERGALFPLGWKNLYITLPSWYCMTKIIHTGIDARGNSFSLVRTANGGSKYIWDAGHVWADFTPARKAYIDTPDGNI